jgi:hypothetical protein
VLDEKVDERYYSGKEGSREVLSVLDSHRVPRAERKTSVGPWDGSDEIGDHKDVVPVVIIGRRDIGPSAASQRSKETYSGDELG